MVRRRSKWFWVFGFRIRIVVGIYVGFCVLAMLFEEKLIYYPTRYPDGDWTAPGRIGLEVEDVFLQAQDGVAVHGWWTPPPVGGPCLLFFHGNAGNVSQRAEMIKSWSDRGWGVFALDYRGYGKSEGKPSEKSLYSDAESALEWLVGERQIPPRRLVVYGRSLGGGVATELAVRHPEVGGLILEATFRSLAAIGQRHYPILPVGLLLRTRFDNLSKMPEMRIPVFVVHGRRDGLVPIEEGEALFAELPDDIPKEFFPVSGAGHEDLLVKGRILKRMAELLASK